MAKVPLHRNNAIGIANAALRWNENILGRAVVEAANNGEEEAIEIVEGLIGGASGGFLKKTQERLQGFGVSWSPGLQAKKRRFLWYEILTPPKANGAVIPGKQWAYALCVLQIVNAERVEWFGRCPACTSYYFRDPRAETCSTKCGNRIRTARSRARKKREKS